MGGGCVERITNPNNNKIKVIIEKVINQYTLYKQYKQYKVETIEKIQTTNNKKTQT